MVLDYPKTIFLTGANARKLVTAANAIIVAATVLNCDLVSNIAKTFIFTKINTQTDYLRNN